VFRVEAGGRTLFLKLADRAGAERELAVLELAGSVGVPVPVIEAADPAGAIAGAGCILLREAGGTPCDSTSPEFAAVAARLRLLHEVTLGGFGPVTAGDAGLRGEDVSWADCVRQRTGELGPLADAGLVSAGLLDRASTAVLTRPRVLSTPHGGRLLHGDFHPRHVYARGGRVTAIIDWADAVSGNPVFDLGRVLHAATTEHDLRHGHGVLRRFLDSYGEAPWLGPDLAESLLVHATVFILWAMRCELAGGSPWPPWWPVQTAALTAILDELGPS
jgi:aminoglycoside phosphotransferase (APT) family kinase protein